MTGADVERRIVTVLFCDLVGFTSLSERLDAEDVSIVQEAYFSGVKDAVARYGGQLEKFIGDAAVAIFGTPASRDDDAERAVRCGFAIAGALQQVCARLGMDEDALRVRVGVNTGESVVHPNPTPGEPMVTGDTVNTAARLQAAAPPGGVLLGPTTALAVADAIEVEDAGPVDLKGKAEPIRASLAVAVRPEPSRDAAMGALRAPMLGREGALRTLSSARDRVLGGAAERWVIVAQPGIGKTRLLTEFSDETIGRGVAVRRARLRPDVVGPYQAVAQLFVSSLRDAGLDLTALSDTVARRDAAAAFLVERLVSAGIGPGRAEVVRDEVLAVTWPDVGGETEPVDREVRFTAWLEALDALAGPEPDVWLVEDVHWAGGDLLAFLDATIAAGSPRLVLATARPSLLEAAPAWCAENASAGRRLLHLPPLAPPDAANLVRALIGSALEPELVARLVDRSDGNPLFIEELLRTWVSVGLLAESSDGWRLTAPVAEVPLPATVQSIYSAQLDDLAADERLVARRASVAGRRFPIAALPTLGIDEPDRPVEALRRRALVSGPETDPFAGDTYAYRHALLRDAGYASLARAERARLHVRLARWIEQVAGDRWAAVAEVVAGHYAAAVESTPALRAHVDDGLPTSAVAALAADWLERAAVAAVGLAAHEAARALLARSIDLTPADAPLDRARRLELLGRTTAITADMDDGISLLEEAMELGRSRMDEPEASADERRAGRQIYSRAAGSLGDVLGQQVRFQEMIDLADRVIHEIGDRDDVEVARLLLLRSRGKGMISESLARTNIPDIDRALKIARDSGDLALELDARYERLWATVEGGEVSLEEPEALEQLARRLGRWDRAAEALRAQGNLRFPDHPDEVLVSADRLGELAEARGLTETLAWADYQRAEAGFQLGDWDGALESGTRALDLAERNAYHRAAVRTWHVIVPLAAMRGDVALLGLAHAWFTERDASLPDSPYARVMRSAIDAVFARFALQPRALPDLAYVREGLSEGTQLPSWFVAVHVLVGAWIAAGRLDHARGAVEALDASARSRPFRLDEAVRDLERSSVIHAMEGDVRDVETAARKAAGVASDLGSPWWRLQALRLLDAASAATDAERAEAEAIEDRLGLVAPAP